jgi:hypothetical protein|tara:strand:+ start:11004 stop:11180 length:177 start_codon:yes stop_codon:yes gene_type:complete
MSETVRDIINKLKDSDNVGANKAFNDAMSEKMTAALDAEKINVASKMVTKKAEDEGEE